MPKRIIVRIYDDKRGESSIHLNSVKQFIGFPYPFRDLFKRWLNEKNENHIAMGWYVYRPDERYYHPPQLRLSKTCHVWKKGKIPTQKQIGKVMKTAIENVEKEKYDYLEFYFSFYSKETRNDYS